MSEYYYNPRHKRGAYASIVACVAPDGHYPPDLPGKPTPPDYGHGWSIRDASVLDGLTKLYRQGDYTYYGYL